MFAYGLDVGKVGVGNVHVEEGAGAVRRRGIGEQLAPITYCKVNENGVLSIYKFFLDDCFSQDCV